ncbi:hypothetical protein VTL71DRAFT_4553 [Oculimacula yallundae]|uniref:Uncharacterized protein n=1 Tax=Oculimacula yallundae TaxID=86028 RepID=A0ABR4C2C8_9HELO
MANFDSNHWHWIYQGSAPLEQQSQFLGGTSLYSNGTTGAVFFSEENEFHASEHLWQIYTFNTTYFVLRSKNSGPLGYLTTFLTADDSTPGRTRPRTTNASIADDSMLWQIKPWGGGTFWFENATEANQAKVLPGELDAPVAQPAELNADQRHLTELPAWNSR